MVQYELWQTFGYYMAGQISEDEFSELIDRFILESQISVED